MAWSAPMTAVANSAFTAAQFNQYVRDNLLETAPAKATTTGRLFVATGANAIAERVISTASVTTAETTSSTGYVDLTTTGPSVTLTTGTNALVWVTAQMFNGTANIQCYASFEVTGASSQAPATTRAAIYQTAATTTGGRVSAPIQLTTLTPGSNSFTMQYRVNSGTGTFANRQIIVMGL